MYAVQARTVVTQIEQLLLKNECSRKHIWNLFQVDRVGHSVLDPRVFSSMFGVSFEEVAILIPKGRKIANKSYLEYFCYGAQFIEIENLQLAYVIHCAEILVAHNERYYYFIGRNVVSLQRSLLPQKRIFPTKPEMDISHWQEATEARYNLKGRPYVVLHHRQPGWFVAAHHAHRNSSLESLMPAINYLQMNGYNVVRIGDPSMPAAPHGCGIIDTTRAENRQDYDDIALVYGCSFFFGTASGPTCLAEIFEKPTLCHNYTSFPNSFGGEVFILFKRYFDSRNARFLSYEEIFTSWVGFCEDFNLLDKAGISIFDNSSVEIFEAIRFFVDFMKMCKSDRIADLNRLKSLNNKIQSDLFSKPDGEIFDMTYARHKVPFLY